MQSNSVYLYPNKVNAYTNVPGTWLTERYRRVYNRNLKIYSGVDNNIDLQVKNTDQKPVNITGTTLVFNLIRREDQKLILTRDCDTQTAESGKVSFSITETDLVDIEPGFYNFSVHQEVRTIDDPYTVTSRTPLYIDSQYGVISTIEILSGIRGTPTDSVEITKFSRVSPSATGDAGNDFLISSLIDAKYQTTDPNSNHTFALYFTNFNGSVEIQGSLGEGNPGQSSWATLETIVVEDTQSLVYQNITGKWRWFRVKESSHVGAAAYFSVQQTTLGNYIVDLNSGGKNYTVGQTIVIYGSKLGGTDGENDITITVTDVDIYGAITREGFTYIGTSVVGFRTFLIGGSEPAPVGSLDKILYR